MKPPATSGRYELVPARMVLCGIPRPAKGSLPTEIPEDHERFEFSASLPVDGISTLPACVADARGQAGELLRRCQGRLRQGDRSAIVELLDGNPAFVAVGWVRETLVRLLEGGLPLRRRGRPRGRYKVHPLVVVGVVDQLIATGRAPNREQAFALVEKLGLMSYDRVKQVYYQVRRDSRFRGVFLEFPELKVEVSPDEVAHRLSRGEALRPGRAITRTWEDPAVGTVQITFRGR